MGERAWKRSWIGKTSPGGQRKFTLALLQEIAVPANRFPTSLFVETTHLILFGHASRGDQARSSHSADATRRLLQGQRLPQRTTSAHGFTDASSLRHQARRYRRGPTKDRKLTA